MTDRSTHRACRHEPDAVARALGQLAGRAARRFADHEAGCPACARTLAETRALAQRLRATAPSAEPSAGLTARILAALPGDASPAPARRPAPASPWAPALGLALAAALVVATGYFATSLLRPRGDPAQPAVAAAAAAADWLAAQQQPDGSWLPSHHGGRDAYRPALTALALLALQEHAPARHAAAIARAAQALRAMQQPDGALGADDGARMYNHAFAAHALLRLAAARPAGAPDAALARAIAFTRAAQNAQGGWDYEPRGAGNTALTVWQVSLLAQARAQGWPDDGGHLRRGLSWLCSRADDAGSFGYRARGVPPAGGDGVTLTAMAAAALGEAARDYPALAPAARAAVDALRRRHAMALAGDGQPDYYRDYFVTRALASETEARAEVAAVARAVAARRRAGSGLAPWQATDAWGATGGDLYATALALLTPGAAG